MEIGNALFLNALWVRCQSRQTLNSEQFVAGVTHLKEKGLVEEIDDGRLLLTEAGFKEM